MNKYVPTQEEREAESRKQRTRNQNTIRITVIGNGILVKEGDLESSIASFPCLEEALPNIAEFIERRMMEMEQPFQEVNDRGNASRRSRIADRRGGQGFNNRNDGNHHDGNRNDGNKPLNGDRINSNSDRFNRRNVRVLGITEEVEEG